MGSPHIPTDINEVNWQVVIFYPFASTTRRFATFNLNNLDVSERFKTIMGQKSCLITSEAALDRLTTDLPSKNSCSQTHGGLIGSLQHLLFGFKGQHRHDRTKDLLPHTGHLICTATYRMKKKERTGTWKCWWDHKVYLDSDESPLTFIVIFNNMWCCSKNIIKRNKIVCNTTKKGNSSSECIVIMKECIEVLLNIHGVM